MGQKIPTAWREREALREKGQFWTPPWLAKTMAAWVAEHSPSVIFDPAAGPGTFFAAARSIGYEGNFAGFELHPQVFSECDRTYLIEADFRDVTEGDFINAPVEQCYPAIISNPPYIRHHRLNAKQKDQLRALSSEWLGFPLDGRVGLHLYFLLKSLEILAPEGRLAFLLPADVCEGVSSCRMWMRICERFRLEAVLTFSEDAAPFPQIDTNAMVFLISKRPPAESFRWVRVESRSSELILAALSSNGSHAHSTERRLAEALETGLSRPQRPKMDALPLSSFAKVVRGIASGANEFFFLTRNQMREYGLTEHYFTRAVGRTRDCYDSILTPQNLDGLEEKGRPTWLLNLKGESKDAMPASLRHYLTVGEDQGLNARALIKQRKPWYKMEQRETPPLLFAYLGRRDCRFILNRAGVVPLTGFLCIYPYDTSPGAVEKLWRALNHPDTLANLAYAAKSYGSGALKAEPRQLDKLLLPSHVLREMGLTAQEPAITGRARKQGCRWPLARDPGQLSLF